MGEEPKEFGRGIQRAKDSITDGLQGLLAESLYQTGLISQRYYEDEAVPSGTRQLGELTGLAHHNAKQTGASGAGAWYQSRGFLLGNMTGLAQMDDAYHNERNVTLQPVGDGFDRWGQASTGLGQFTGTVALASGATMRTGAALGEIGQSTLKSMTLTDTLGPSPLPGARAVQGSLVEGSGGVQTPHGIAWQGQSASSFATLDAVQSGAAVYRAGFTNVNAAAEGQFWSLTNPASTAGYAGKMGMPSLSVPPGELAFNLGGTLRSAASGVTRPAPGIGSNAGGAPELVVPSGGVQTEWFHMP